MQKKMKILSVMMVVYVSLKLITVVEDIRYLHDLQIWSMLLNYGCSSVITLILRFSNAIFLFVL